MNKVKGKSYMLDPTRCFHCGEFALPLRQLCAACAKRLERMSK